MRRYLRSLPASFVLAAFVFATATAQSPAPSPKPAPHAGTLPRADAKISRPDLGSVQNSVYTNNYFNLHIPVPAGWNVHDEESRRRIMQSGNAELSDMKPELADNLNQSLQRTLNLLAFDNLSINSADGGAAALLVGAELIPAGQTMTVTQYMETTKRLVMSMPDCEMVEDIHIETIGGAACGAMTIKRAMGGVTMKQKYVGLIRKGYAIFLVTAYTNDKAGRTLDDILKRSRFN